MSRCLHLEEKVDTFRLLSPWIPHLSGSPIERELPTLKADLSLPGPQNSPLWKCYEPTAVFHQPWLSLSLFYVCVYMMCMCGSMLAWVWGLLYVDKVARSFPWMLFHLILWGQVSQSISELTNMSSLTSQLALGIHSQVTFFWDWKFIWVLWFWKMVLLRGWRAL